MGDILRFVGVAVDEPVDHKYGNIPSNCGDADTSAEVLGVGRDGDRGLGRLLCKAGDGVRLSEHLDGDGPAMFRHACAMGLEGIVSKRRDRPYRSGRSLDWLKVKNPNAPAATRIIDW